MAGGPAGYALLGSSEWGGFDVEAMQIGDPDQLGQRYPAMARNIESFCRAEDDSGELGG
jgi:hypothetical protein